MAWDGMTPEQMVAAQQQIDQYGDRAREIVSELIDSCANNDHYKGGALCKEMYEEPNLLMLVVGLLTTNLIQAKTAPLMEPSELGVDMEAPAEPWEVGVFDQMTAAAEDHDLNTFAKIAMDAQVRAYSQDTREHGEEIPFEILMRGYMLMDRVSVIALAAESLRRLVRLEVEKGGD